MWLNTLTNFLFNDTATTEIYTLSLHDALPISASPWRSRSRAEPGSARRSRAAPGSARSEEHTSELQSPDHLVCRLLLEKKKKAILVLVSMWLNMYPKSQVWSLLLQV